MSISEDTLAGSRDLTDLSSTVEIDELRKTFGTRGRDRTVALDDVSLSLASGELIVLLGPSGCGKSTTLRSVAGLESPDAGRIALGREVVFDTAGHRDLPPERRDIGMVFQNFALWPHMTVEQIVRFPLKARRRDKATAERRVAEALSLVDCSDLAKRHPGELSGGQQQRVALARALAAEPNVLLFDEPLSNLDAALRADLRNEIDRIHREAGFAGIYVTHDQTEALAVADRIAVMNSGRLVQVDAAATVYQRPCDEWVAGFMGYTNRVVRDARAGRPANGHMAASHGAEVVYRFRPGAVEMMAPGDDAPEGALVLDGRAVTATFVGYATEYGVEVGGEMVDVRLDLRRRGARIQAPVATDPIRLVIEQDDLLSYPAANYRQKEST